MQSFIDVRYENNDLIRKERWLTQAIWILIVGCMCDGSNGCVMIVNI